MAPSETRRATRACLSCRLRKTKCFFINSDSFACSRCLSLNRICSFQEELIKLGKFLLIEEVFNYEKTQLRNKRNSYQNFETEQDNSNISSVPKSNLITNDNNETDNAESVVDNAQTASSNEAVNTHENLITKSDNNNSSGSSKIPKNAINKATDFPNNNYSSYTQKPFNINDLLSLGSPLGNNNSLLSDLASSSSTARFLTELSPNSRKLDEIHSGIKQILQILSFQASTTSPKFTQNKSAASAMQSLHPTVNTTFPASSQPNLNSSSHYSNSKNGGNVPTNMLPLSFITSPFNILKESPNNTYLPFPIQNLIKPIIYDFGNGSNMADPNNQSNNNTGNIGTTVHKQVEESIVLKIISYAEYLQILNIFQKYYGKWISLNDAHSSMELLNTLRLENPVLLDIITYLIIIRHNSHSNNNNNITSSIFTRLSLNESLIVSKISQFVSSQILNNTIALSLENISNLTLLSVFGYTLSKSSPSFFSLNVDPWLYSGLALKHFVSSINYNPKFLDFTMNINMTSPTHTAAAAAAAAVNATASGSHPDKCSTNSANKDPLLAEFDILKYMRNHDHLLVTHLFNCIISGRSCSIDLLRMSKIRVKLDNIYAGTFDGKMTAEIYLCDIIYQYLLKEDLMCVEKVVRSQFNEVQRNLNQWSNDWNYLIVQPIPQLLEFMFNFYQILIHYHYMFQSTFFQIESNHTITPEKRDFGNSENMRNENDERSTVTDFGQHGTTVGEYEWQKSIYFDQELSPPQPSPLFAEFMNSGDPNSFTRTYPTLKMVILKTKNNKLLIRMLKHCFATIDEIIKFIDNSMGGTSVKSGNDDKAYDVSRSVSGDTNLLDGDDGEVAATDNGTFMIDFSDISEQFQYASDMIHLSVFITCIFSMNIICCYFEREAAAKIATKIAKSNRNKNRKKSKDRKRQLESNLDNDPHKQAKKNASFGGTPRAMPEDSSSDSVGSLAAELKKEYIEYFNLHGKKASKINFHRSLNKYLIDENYESDEELLDESYEPCFTGHAEFKINKRQFVKYINCLLVIIVQFKRCSCVKSLLCNLFYRYSLTLKDHLQDMFSGIEIY